jgi:sigma-B regulation protein RsbU (phosphoserine phosphatase)
MHSQVEERRAFAVSGKPIGLPLPDNSYEAGKVRFRKGERLAVFSDGVTDAENTAEETYDEKGVASAHARCPQADVEEIGRAFFEDLDRFRIGAPSKDDTTYLIIGLD